MLKMPAAALFATLILASAANAKGGGAETAPGTNFTDMPDYRPKVSTPCVRIKHACKHGRWHQGLSRGN